MNGKPFVEALLHGARATADDWRGYFRAYHAAQHNLGRGLHARLRDESGRNTYETVAAAVPAAATSALDVGCGDGALVPYLRAKVPALRYTGVDISPEETQRARRDYGNDRTTFIESDATQLPFAPESFDCALSHMAIMLVQPVAAALHEIRRVLRPDGSAVLFVENRAAIQAGALPAAAARFLRERFPEMAAPVTNPDVRSEEKFVRAVREAGFAPVRTDALTFGAVFTEAEAIDLVLSFYIYASLDERSEAELREHLSGAARAAAQPDGNVPFTMSYTLVVAQPELHSDPKRGDFA